jgi:hypothetical protein
VLGIILMNLSQGMSHSARDCKNKAQQNGVQNGRNQNHFQRNSSNGACYTHCHRSGHQMGNCLKLRNKSNRNGGTNSHENQDQRVFNSNDVAFATAVMENSISRNVWILDSGAKYHY